MSPDLSGLTEVFFVGAGGFVGASLRFIMSGLVQRLDPMGTFPYGTMSVNVSGCLVIGILGAWPIPVTCSAPTRACSCSSACSRGLHDLLDVRVRVARTSKGR